MSGAKVSKAVLRGYELKEAKDWKALGWLAQTNWKQARYVPGRRCPTCKRPRLITLPKDFFDGFDNLFVHPAGKVAFVQVTASPFVKERDGKADRNAAHGEPPFSFVPLSGIGVEAWRTGPENALTGVFPSLGTVIVSYADARKPERRWWTAEKAKSSVQQ